MRIQPLTPIHRIACLPIIRRSQRANFIGPSGSGKTELMRSFLRAQRNAIILDTKHTEAEDWDTVGERVSERDVYRVKGGRFVYHTEPDFLVNPELPEKFFRWALKAGRRVIAVDEMLDIIPVPGMKIFATQCRANHGGLWVATQRPTGIPLYSISEANHSFIFRLRVDRDKERIESVTGTKINWDALRAEHAFIYISETGRVSQSMRLDLAA